MNGYSRYEDCRVLSVEKVSSEYIINIGTKVDKNVQVKVRNTNFLVQLNDIKDNKRDRCYFSSGMTNIDVFKTSDQFVIQNSPNDYVCDDYFMSEIEFSKILELQ